MRRDGAANRERILLAAEQVFGAGGTDASTEEVARRAGVGIATVFRHFPTKQELVEATALRYLDGLQTQVSRLVDAADPGPALAAAVRLLVSTGPVKVRLLNVLLVEGNDLTPSVTTAVETVRGEVGRILERAQGAGAARADVTAEQVFTLSRALAHVSDPGEDRAISEAIDQAVGIVLDGLGVHR